MVKNPEKLKESRRKEIISAFFRLYETKNFSEINIKEIGKETSFTRTSIYNYFTNIDEIFLSAYSEEYLRWADDIEKFTECSDTMTAERLADGLAQILAKRERMLKLSTLNFNDREVNCRDEIVFSHKEAFGTAINRMAECLEKFCPAKSKEEIDNMLYIFFPFLHGMYRYVGVTDVTVRAIEKANLRLKNRTVYDLAYNLLIRLVK